MRPVLGKAPVAGFNMAELALEDPERMLNLGPHLRDDPIDLFVELVQLATLGGFAHDAPEGVAIFREGRLSSSMDVALVSPDRCLLTVQELVPDLAVMGLGRGGLQAVDDAAVSIYAHMGFHPEVPVIALLG